MIKSGLADISVARLDVMIKSGLKMNPHGQFRANRCINISFQVSTEYKSQRRVSSLINKISIFPVVTLAK